MSIGSAPEAGVRFARWADMTASDRRAWFAYMTAVWGSDLLGGYATLIRKEDTMTNDTRRVVRGHWERDGTGRFYRVADVYCTCGLPAIDCTCGDSYQPDEEPTDDREWWANR